MCEHHVGSVELPVSRRLNELYNRRDCKKCCRVLFASVVNVISRKKTTPPRTSFLSSCRVSTQTTHRFQTAVVRSGADGVPLVVHSDELQYFVFALFKTQNMFMHPTRVHDFRGSFTHGTRLIQLGKKPPKLESTMNLLFIQVYNHTDTNYTGTVYNAFKSFKKHFHTPNNTQAGRLHGRAVRRHAARVVEQPPEHW